MANLIREVVSETLIKELQDPRIGFITVTEVDVTPDFRYADVYVSVLGDEKQAEKAMEAIRHAHGYVQDEVADALTTKFCPVIRFHKDESVKKSVDLSRTIAEARAEDEAARAERIRRGVEEPPDEDEPPGTDEIRDQEQNPSEPGTDREPTDEEHGA